MKKIIITIVFVQAALGSSALAVSTVEAKYLGVSPRKAVHLQANGANRYVYAGLYNFQKLSYHDDAPGGPGSRIGEFFSGYCIDLNQGIHTGRVDTWELRDLQDAPVSPSMPMGEDKAGLLRRLWGSCFEQSADFQIAVWEILNESDGADLDVLDGNFLLTNPPEVDADKINGWLDAITAPGYAGAESNLLFGMTNSETQDYVIEIASLPEPMTMLCVFSSIAALGAYVSKRRRA